MICHKYEQLLKLSVGFRLRFCLVFGRPFVKRFALCYRTVVLSVPSVLSVCLSVTFVYCGQTVGWIKMKLRVVAGLGTGHIVLDGDPAPPRKGTVHTTQQPPLFGPYLYCGQTVAHLSNCRALVVCLFTFSVLCVFCF